MYLFKFATLVLLVSLRFAETKPISYKDYNRFSNIIPGNSQSLNNKGFPIADNAGIQTPDLQDPTLTDIKSKLYPNNGIPSSLEDAKRQMVDPVQPNNFYPNLMNESNVNSYRGHWNGQVPLYQSNEISNSDKRNETVQDSIDHHPGSNPSFNGANSDTPKETTQLSLEQPDSNVEYVDSVNDLEEEKYINPNPDEDQIINGNIDSNVSEEHAYVPPAVNPNSVFSNAQMYNKNVSEENTLDAQNPQFEGMHLAVQSIPENGLHDSPSPYQDPASLSQVGEDSENISEKSEDEPQDLSEVQLSSEQGHNKSQEFSDTGESITRGVTEDETHLQESYPGSKESFEERLDDNQNSSESQVYSEQGYEDNQASRKEGVDDSEGFSNNGSNNEMKDFERLPNGNSLIDSQPSLEENNTNASDNTDTLQFEESDVRYEEVNSFPTGESEVIDSVSHFEDVFNENTSHSLVSENTMASNNQNFTLYPEYTNSLSDQLKSSLATDATNKNLNTMKDYQYTLNDDVDQYRHGNDGAEFVKVESAVTTDEVVETISKSEEKQIENGDEVSNSLFRNDEAYEYNGNYSENNGINENELNESNLENHPFDDTNGNPFLSSTGEDELNNEGVELDMSETASDDTALSTNEDYGEENYNGKNTLEEVDKGFTWEDSDVDGDMFKKEGTQGYDIDESTDDDRNEEIAYEDDLYSVDGDNIDSRLTGQDDIEQFVDEEMDTSLLDKDLTKLDVQNDSFSFITFFVIFTFLIVFAMLYCGGLGKFKHLMFVALHKGKGSRLSWKRDGYSLVSHRGTSSKSA